MGASRVDLGHTVAPTGSSSADTAAEMAKTLLDLASSRPLPVAVVAFPTPAGGSGAASETPTITPSFGLGAGRSPTPGGTPAQPAKVEVLDESDYAALVKQIGAQAADAMVKQDLVRLKRTAPAEASPAAPTEPPHALPDFSLPDRGKAPDRSLAPAGAALPAEYALPEVIPIRGHTRPPPIESVGEQMDRDRNEEEADAASQRRKAAQVPYQQSAKLLGQVGMPNAAQAMQGGAEVAGAESAMGAAGGYVMVAQAVGKMVAGGFDAVKGGVETAGHVTSDMARNDYMGAFTKSVDAAGDSLKKIPVVGEPAAAALGAVVQPIKSFGEVVDSFVQRGREIGMYNGQLAQANAMADVRSLMGDIREANTVGPEMARLTEAQSKIWDDLRRVLDPIKKVIAEVLANFLEWLEPWVRNELPKIMIQIAESLVGVTAAFNRFTNFQFTKETLKVVEALKAIEDALRKQADPINPLDVFSKMADRVWDVPAEPDPVDLPLFPPAMGGN